MPVLAENLIKIQRTDCKCGDTVDHSWSWIQEWKEQEWPGTVKLTNTLSQSDVCYLYSPLLCGNPSMLSGLWFPWCWLCVIKPPYSTKNKVFNTENFQECWCVFGPLTLYLWCHDSWPASYPDVQAQMKTEQQCFHSPTCLTTIFYHLLK